MIMLYLTYIPMPQSTGATKYTDFPNECPNQSDGEIPVIQELWGMWSTPLLPLLPGSIWPGVVAPEKGSIYGFK